MNLLLVLTLTAIPLPVQASGPVLWDWIAILDLSVKYCKTLFPDLRSDLDTRYRGWDTGKGAAAWRELRTTPEYQRTYAEGERNWEESRKNPIKRAELTSLKNRSSCEGDIAKIIDLVNSEEFRQHAENYLEASAKCVKQGHKRGSKGYVSCLSDKGVRFGGMPLE